MSESSRAKRVAPASHRGGNVGTPVANTEQQTRPWPDIATLARNFGERPDISARSVLVTIFGDSVVPTGGEVWLGELIGLCEPFGINDRLVRTSMFRLGADGWFDTERVGRRSRYRLTPSAIAEFAAADERIYGAASTGWDGTWTMVFIDAVTNRSARDRLALALRRRGFTEWSATTMATVHPRGPHTAAELTAQHHRDSPVPVANVRFQNLDELIAAGWPLGGFGLEPLAGRYRDLIERHGWAATPPPSSPSDRDAFLTRTMLVHDLRRVRLADPDLPEPLWPPDWPAPEVLRRLGAAYHLLSPGAWRWVQANCDSATKPRPLRRFR